MGVCWPHGPVKILQADKAAWTAGLEQRLEQPGLPTGALLQCAPRWACTVQTAAGQLHGWQPSLKNTHANPGDPHACCHVKERQKQNKEKRTAAQSRHPASSTRPAPQERQVWQDGRRASAIANDVQKLPQVALPPTPAYAAIGACKNTARQGEVVELQSATQRALHGTAAVQASRRTKKRERCCTPCAALLTPKVTSKQADPGNT